MPETTDTPFREFFTSDFCGPRMTAPLHTISCRDGRVAFNARSVQLMGLRVGDRLSYIEDPQHPRRWGFRKTDDVRGFLMKLDHAGIDVETVCITSKALTRHLSEKASMDCNFRAQIGTEPQDGVWWILEASITPTKPANRR